MAEEKGREELVRVYRDASRSDDVIIEVLGQPVGALKQMKAEPWKLSESAKSTDTGKPS
ncbi:hypothetical protein [Rhizobium phaseoli]|uniref:hypothetical protein n=1 Tax=Rhizobium phaseoli TaxID=396 RepID=UPI0013DFAC6D|nr:hypothetical protein [Rhizobium phaseoli]